MFVYLDYQRVDTPPALIEVWAGEKAPQPVSRLLYGKFTEHLGYNIYHGMWAQVLDNPGFEPPSRLARDEQTLGQWLRHRAWHLGHAEAPVRSEGVAPPWEPVGSVTCSLVPDGVQGTAQRIAAQAPDAGLRQATCLPLHRTGNYRLSLWVRGDAGARLRVCVRQTDGRLLGSAVLSRISRRWTRRHLALTLDRHGVPAGAPLYFTLTLDRPGSVDLDQAFLFPADHVHGFDPDVVRLLRESKLPLLRYPGGNFVSGYHWQNGVGPVDQRPTLPNPAWDVPEYNHVGTDEFVAFCRAVGCEPMICINAGDGTPEEAAAWVEYCNGSPETRWGAVRARNGHRRPYRIRFWEVGNELWGDWQVGHCTAQEYAARYVAFARAMRAVDPSIQLIACGADPSWNAPVLAQREEAVRSVSVHTLPGSHIPADAPPVEVWREAMAFPVAYREELRGLAQQMAEAGHTPRLAITELQLFTNKPSLPNNGNLAEALFLAGIIHTAARLGETVEMITHSALVNHAGGLRKFREVVFPNPVHFTSLLYATTPGRWPVRVRLAAPGYDCTGRWLPAVRNVPVLDALAMVDDTGRTLSLMVINRDPERAVRASIRIHGLKADRVRSRILTGAHFMAANEWNRTDAVGLRSQTVDVRGGEWPYEFPAHSVTELVLTGE